MSIYASIKRLIRILQNRSYGWSGNYKSWGDAVKQSGGYNQQQILEKVKDAALKVKNGEAIFERDSVLFDKIEYSWPLLSALMWVAAINKARLHVLDFGGSLGSSYFQNKYFLETLDNVKWDIVEQQNFVQSGQMNIEDGNLRFFNTVNEAMTANGLPDIVLFACTLPYLENPYSILQEIMKTEIPYLLVDNTYFNYEEGERICVQKVPPGIYEASYPCWFLDYAHVKQKISEKYTIISEHNNESIIYLDGRKIQYKGFLAKIN